MEMTMRVNGNDENLKKDDEDDEGDGEVKAYKFLDAFSHLYKRVCPSVGPSVRPLVGRSVRRSHTS